MLRTFEKAVATATDLITNTYPGYEITGYTYRWFDTHDAVVIDLQLKDGKSVTTVLDTVTLERAHHPEHELVWEMLRSFSKLVADEICKNRRVSA